MICTSPKTTVSPHIFHHICFYFMLHQMFSPGETSGLLVDAGWGLTVLNPSLQKISGVFKQLIIFCISSIFPNVYLLIHPHIIKEEGYPIKI